MSIDVRISPARDLDDAAKLASYSLEIADGGQFQMGQVYLDGLPPGVAAAWLEKWKLKPGDVFDASYPPTLSEKQGGEGVGAAGKRLSRYGCKRKPMRLAWSSSFISSFADKSGYRDVSLRAMLRYLIPLCPRLI